MDAKITKQRLKRLFSYEWIKMIAVVVALIFGWVMIFELTETRIKPSQRFTIFNHMQNKAIVPLTEKKIQGAFNDNAFSSEVIEITYQDLSTAGMYNHQTLESYLGVSDGDIMLVPNLVNPTSTLDKDGDNKPDTDENGDIIYQYTYPESLINPYRKYMTNLNPQTEGSYFYELEQYLNGFYDNGWEDETSINTQKIEREFRARVARTHDKRYRNEKLLSAAIPYEIERIEKYRDAYAKLCGWLVDGLVCFNAPTHIDGHPEDGVKGYDGIVSLNICPDESRMKNLKAYYSYPVYGYDEEQEKTQLLGYSAKDMSVVFFYNPEQEKTFEYESLLYVVWLVEQGISTNA